MNVGILGTGDVGRTLGRGFVTLGLDVKVGGRGSSNDRAAAWANEMGGRASTGTFAEATAFGDIVLLATLGTATEDAVRSAGLERFRDKLVIDATNPLDFADGKPRLAIGHTDSLGERVQRLFRMLGS